MKKTIEIPEGYEARIEGNKVILERKESEDERIRKAIESIIRVYGKTHGEWIAGYDMDTLVVHLRDAFACLEKQKEQKTAIEEVLIKAGLKPFKDGNQWCILVGDNIQEGVCGFGDTIEDALYEFLKEVCEQQKLTEWSEEYRKEDLQTRFAFYTYKDEDSILYLSNVFVEETSRNKGFGTKILQAAEMVAQTIGALTIRLKVKQNTPANDWYRRHGYGYLVFEDGYDWLEKNLEYLKPKQKWSETDKLHLNNAILVAKKEWGVNSYTARFLEALRDNCKKCNSRWKPSEEQMEALKLACKDAFECPEGGVPHMPLKSLLSDLQNYFSL